MSRVPTPVFRPVVVATRFLVALLALAVLGLRPPGATAQDAAGPHAAPDAEYRPFMAQVLVQPNQDFSVPRSVPGSFGQAISVAEVVVVDDQGNEKKVAPGADLFQGKTPPKGGKVKLLAAGGAVLGAVALVAGGSGGGGGGGGGGGTPAGPTTAAQLAPVVDTVPGPTLPLPAAGVQAPAPPPAPSVPADATPGLVMPDGPNPIVVRGEFDPPKVSSYDVAVEFTDPPTPDASPIVAHAETVFATGDSLVAIIAGAPDQTGPVRVTVTDTETGKTRVGDFRGWLASVEMAMETTNPGEPVPGRIIIKGLDAETEVRFNLYVPEGTLVASGSTGQSWSGVMTVGKLTASPFSVNFASTGVKNVFLDLEPLKTDPKGSR